MLGEGGKRGSTLESTLMKILHMAGMAVMLCVFRNTVSLILVLSLLPPSQGYKGVTIQLVGSSVWQSLWSKHPPQLQTDSS